jgi:hypothetical protein
MYILFGGFRFQEIQILGVYTEEENLKNFIKNKWNIPFEKIIEDREIYLTKESESYIKYVKIDKLNEYIEDLYKVI